MELAKQVLPHAVERTLTLSAATSRWLSLASSQNGVPVVRELTVELKSAESARQVELRVTSAPAFIYPFSLRIDRIDPTRPRTFQDLKIQANHEYLAGLTEAFEGSLQIEALIDGEAVASIRAELKLLPADQWEGLNDIPEILAAHVQPNHPVVGQILARAGAILKLSGISGLSGYQQQSREIVGRQVAAIYGAIRERDLVYVNPPAQFHTLGQRIRLPDQIAHERLATCLDLAVLFAACLEQAGLHPLILMSEDHAWLGCWLDEGAACASPVDEDGQTLRKRRVVGELLSLELTLLTQKGVLFSEAQRVGIERLNDETKFRAAFDVRLARQTGIRPIPSRVNGIFEVPKDAPVDARAQKIDAVEVTDIPLPSEADPDAEPLNLRLEQWKRKLLDLSLRNKLINFKATAKMLKVLGADLALIEDALADHKSFGFEVNPRYENQKDPSTGNKLPAEPVAARLESHLKSARDRLKLTMFEEDKEKLDTRLTDLYRTARTAEDESGVSPLFLALGMIEWKETDRSTTTLRAPILLVPVELDRSSVRAGLSGFSLISRDEETRINPTLLEKLRRDYGIAFDVPDVAPTDDSGVDVNRILGLFRHIVVNRKGWDVKDEIWLGEFSFKKFLMWRDLQERESALRAHPIVDQMLERPHSPMASQGEFPNPRELDHLHAPSEVFTPLVADSSQLAAIQAASEGKSFVLEGPPGTGKSQTITNLIAHCMAHGKTVLFISEKKAALEVVRKRLSDINLGAYCLEVHSDKARKTEVIEQLKAPLAVNITRVQAKWQATSDSLGKTRSRLNEYVEALHHRYPCELSIYECTGWLCQNPSVTALPLTWGDPEVGASHSIESMRSLVNEIPPPLSQLGALGTHALQGSLLSDSSPLIERSCKEATKAALNSVLALIKVLDPVLQRLACENNLNSNELDSVAELAKQLLLLPALPRTLGAAIGHNSILGNLRYAATTLAKQQELVRDLATHFRADFLASDVNEVEALFLAAKKSWWLKSWMKKRALRAYLSRYTNDGSSLAYALENVEESTARVRLVRALDNDLKDVEGKVISFLGEAWAGPQTDPQSLLRFANWLEAVQATLNKLARLDSNRLKRIQEGVRNLATIGYDDVAGGGALAVELKSLDSARSDFVQTMARVMEVLRFEPTTLDPAAAAYLARAAKWLGGIGNALGADHLRFWAAWQRLRTQATAAGLSPLTEYCEASDSGVADLPQVFEASIRQWLVEEGLSRSAPLKNFIGKSQDQLIKEFRALDAEYLGLASAAAATRVDARIPRESLDTSFSKEWALLNRELNKKSRHQPLRKIFAGMPTLMARIKPCLLMSPLSVAQHLDTEFPPFDLVVFDEASQIPVWDAIGAIARARQAIIVGDPKQLPPTSFFSRADDDEEIIDAPEDLESILDETMTTLPVRRLEWHYRSRYESLITFSNRRYYNGKLVTFPSPVAEDRAVQLHRVDGIYGRGTSRTNRQEAEAVVAFVLEHLRSPERSTESIGIVTFNAPQQQLIDDLLDNARREDPALEPYFAKGAGMEEVFVKNLENVQGDERDVIIFSTTFGLDDIGKPSMNFGPINGANGPRRLNVAITRSRLAMHVFTSIPQQMLDTTRTTSVGVKHLKEFLDYAERGVNALRESSEATSQDPESPFEEAVAAALRAKGWNVHYQVGCGGYRIDLGIVNPKAPGRYLAGVECDGASYHSGATARDRDRLRQYKLEELGWTLHRIWSTEWWRRPGQETETLHKALNAQLANFTASA
jgi:very-short-patch-repair endonuclease